MMLGHAGKTLAPEPPAPAAKMLAVGWSAWKQTMNLSPALHITNHSQVVSTLSPDALMLTTEQVSWTFVAFLRSQKRNVVRGDAVEATREEQIRSLLQSTAT